LRDAGLRLKPSKCSLFKRQVAFLGHVVSSEGVACDPAKLEAVETWPVPSTVREVRQFLGLASYYRRYIPGFATIAAPMTALTRKDQKWLWCDKCQHAFDTLKKCLLSAPILAYPSEDPECKYILDIDASAVGIGAVLQQVQGGQEKVIAYASKTLNHAQRVYCVTFRELLAVVKFLKHFRHYILGRPFTVRTDHGSLRWLMNFREVEGMVG
jgi:hypothetical protein